MGPKPGSVEYSAVSSGQSLVSGVTSHDGFAKLMCVYNRTKSIATLFALLVCQMICKYNIPHNYQQWLWILKSIMLVNVYCTWNVQYWACLLYRKCWDIFDWGQVING